MFYIKFLLFIAGVIILFNGCSKEIYDSDKYLSSKQVASLSSKSMRLVHEPFRYHLSGDDLTIISLKEAIAQSIEYYKRVPSDTIFYFGKLKYTAHEMIISFRLFLSVIDTEQSYEKIMNRLESEFYLFESVHNNKNSGVLFTGYYEPIFEGSLKRTKKFTIPVYAIPKDLLVLKLGRFRNSLKNRTIVYRMIDNTILPYYTRRQIMQKNILAGQNREIAWMKDPVDLFFMQIQGSGILQLPSGKKVKLRYAGSNGHHYSSIGKLLVDKGAMELKEVSMQSIRQYLKDNPGLRDRILYHNKSYTFFTLEETVDGPRGNIGVPLTPHRSIATDSSIFPKGALAYIVSEIPVFTKNWREFTLEPFSRFSVIQDTGGAIRGPGRVDLFWGNGILAEKSAGTMRSFGKLYFLVAKPEVLNRTISGQL
jgi:membrane-bound lytic murein transglycosylase A